MPVVSDKQKLSYNLDGSQSSSHSVYANKCHMLYT